MPSIIVVVSGAGSLVSPETNIICLMKKAILVFISVIDSWSSLKTAGFVEMVVRKKDTSTTESNVAAE